MVSYGIFIVNKKIKWNLKILLLFVIAVLDGFKYYESMFFTDSSYSYGEPE